MESVTPRPAFLPAYRNYRRGIQRVRPMIEALDIKREVEMLSERLGKTQDYL
jgi:hypothetical protein